MDKLLRVFKKAPAATHAMETVLTDYECPITGDLAQLPVYAMDGHLYGLEEIDKWLAQKGTSPMTRVAIPRIYLRPIQLRDAYTEYCTQRGIAVPHMPVGTIKRDAPRDRNLIIQDIIQNMQFLESLPY